MQINGTEQICVIKSTVLLRNAHQEYLDGNELQLYRVSPGPSLLCLADGPRVGAPKKTVPPEDDTVSLRPPKASKFVKGDIRDRPPNMGTKAILRGFNVKWPFAGAIADGHKLEESQMHDLGNRGYEAGKEYLLIQTPGFTKKQAESEILLDQASWRRRPDKAEILAVIEFTSSRSYNSAADFERGRPLSCIKPTSTYNWKGVGDRFAWKLTMKYVFKTPLEVKTGQTAPWIQITFDDKTGSSAIHAIQSSDQVTILRCSIMFFLACGKISRRAVYSYKDFVVLIFM